MDPCFVVWEMQGTFFLAARDCFKEKIGMKNHHYICCVCLKKQFTWPHKLSGTCQLNYLSIVDISFLVGKYCVHHTWHHFAGANFCCCNFQKKKNYFESRHTPKLLRNPKCHILLGSLYNLQTNVHLIIFNKVLQGHTEAPLQKFTNKFTKNYREQTYFYALTDHYVVQKQKSWYHMSKLAKGSENWRFSVFLIWHIDMGHYFYILLKKKIAHIKLNNHIGE